MRRNNGDAARDPERLGAYWDALVRGGLIAPKRADSDLNPALKEAVRRLQALDAAPAPDAGLADHVWEGLMERSIPANQTRSVLGTATGSIDRAPRTTRITPRLGRAWPIRPMVAFATAAILVLTSMSGYLAYRIVAPGGEPTTPAFQAAKTGTPAAEECTVAPQTRQLMTIRGGTETTGLEGTPASSALPPEVTPNPYGIIEVREDQLPIGPPADAAAVDAIKATWLQLAVCNAANAFDQIDALFTDDYFRRPSVYTCPDGRRTCLGYPPLPERETDARNTTVRDARVLADGRVAAIVEGPGSGPTFLAFVEQPDFWLIDESIVIFQDFSNSDTATRPPGEVGVGVGASCGAPGTPGGAGGGRVVVAGQAVAAGIVATEDRRFSPSELTMAANETLSFLLLNCGSEPIGFVINELNVSFTIAPGEVRSISFSAPAGTYEYYSDLAGQREAGLVGTLNLVEGTPIP